MASYFDDIEFIVEEIVSFQELVKENRLNDISPQDALCHIPRSDGMGTYICGQKANNRFYAIAGKIINERHEFRSRLEPSEIVAHLKRSFVRRIVEATGSVTEKEIRKLVRDVRDAARCLFHDVTYLIPCSLSSDSQMDRFSIGPVRFSKSASIAKTIETFPLEYPEDKLCKAIEYYESFEWVAEISVSECSPVVSLLRANQLLELVFDTLTVVFSSARSNGLSFKNGSPLPRETYLLSINPNSKVKVQHKISWKQHRLPDNWLVSIKSFAFDQFLDQVGRILQPDFYENSEYPLAQRFLSSLRWYGDGVRDQNLSGRIVKFTVAIEILLLTGSAPKKTQTFSKRGHALFTGLQVTEDPQSEREFEWLYNIRSDIVHGRTHNSSITYESSFRAEELCRSSLFYGIQLFREIGFGNEDKLEETFTRLIEANQRKT